MNDYFSEWIQSLMPQLSSEKLELLWLGVEGASQEIKPQDTHYNLSLTLCRWVFGLPEADEARRQEVESTLRAAMRAADPLFPARNNPLEMRILAGAVVSHLLEDADKADALSLACLCAGLGAKGDEGVGQLTKDLGEQASQYIENQSRRVRRLYTSEQLKVTPAHTGLSKVFEKGKVGETVDVNWAKNVSVSLATIAVVLGKLTESIDQVQEKAMENQEVLQEELDLLWWIVGGSSLNLKQPFDEIEALALPLVVGQEIAQMTRFLPRHPAAGKFLEGAMTRGIALQPVRVVDAVQAVPIERRKEWNNDDLGIVGGLCPLSKAVASSCETDGAEWIGTWKKSTGLDEDQVLEPLDLAMRFSNELLLRKAIKSTA